MGLVIIAGAAAVYTAWQQMQQEQPATATATASPVARSGDGSQEDGVLASLARGVYEAIENFSPTDPDWVIGTGENSDATEPAQNE